MFGISWDQASGLLQRALMFGAGLAVARGWISEELAIKIVGVVLAVGGVIWGVKVNTQPALVASVNAMPAVAGVVTKATVEGKALADSVPSHTVAPAGTSAAASIAAK